MIDEELTVSALPGTATMSDDSIVNMAENRARQCDTLFKAAAKTKDIWGAVDEMREHIEAVGFELPLKIGKRDTEGQAAQKAVAACLKVCEEKWWRRQMRVVYGRKVEAVLRREGFCRKEKAPYVSNWTLARWKAAQRRNNDLINVLEVVKTPLNGDDEEVYDLRDCVDASVSNPENRRTELMTRIGGYEQIADGLGHKGVFFTLTCPSKFHAQLHGGGRNSKFNGATPREAMEHLNDMWGQIRAKWSREGIKAYGFRVCEPHHDGTPHFHFILYFHPDDIERAKRVFVDYAFKVDGLESGADKHRCDVIDIDPKKGTGAGYIAKYIAKNIDGFELDTDDEAGVSAKDGAVRVLAWASVWGIRQFQQIGSVSVTVWRELRRQREIFEEEISECAEDLREAANRGDWPKFVELMGGVNVARKDQSLRPFYFERDTANEYGEQVKRLIGLWLKPVGNAIARCFIPTRDAVWYIRHKEVGSMVAAQPPPSDLCQ